MLKCITKDKLKEELRQLWKYENFPIADIEFLIDTIKEIDPIEHGYWINRSNDKHVCSVCQAIVYSEWAIEDEYDYCPFCGAKMDEELMNNIVIKNSNATTVTNTGNAMTTETRGEIMPDSMMFPKTVDEFMEKYKIVDTEEVYTNGAELVPIFRMKQWFDHVDVVEVVRCKNCKHRPSGSGANHDVEFPDEICPCQCEDYWYSWIPRDNFFCAWGEKKEDETD
jgi:DNA-directed RNA polymerase subunit RPC12/RpoP